MSWDKGFDFRNTAAYVTDPANCTYVECSSGISPYPITRNGVTFGFTDSGQDGRDRSTTVDPRIAGTGFNTSLSTTFRIDLPATGQYDINLSIGDLTGSAECYQLLADNGTPLFTLDVTDGGGSLSDAMGNSWTNAAWPGSNVARRVTFSSLIAQLVLGDGISKTGRVGHLFLSQVPAGTGLLLRDPSLSGIGSGGPFFRDPLQ